MQAFLPMPLAICNKTVALRGLFYLCPYGMLVAAMQNTPYAQWVDQRQQTGLLRQLAVPPTGHIHLCHNDYLGLTQHPALISAGQHALAQWGTGSASSALVVGHTALAQQLAQALCHWTQTPHAIVWPTGYQANHSTLCALGQLPHTVFLLDKACHASMIDGVLASGARWHRFKHNSVTHLHSLLEATRKRYPQAPVWVVTESVFSMDGDVAPLAAIVAACQQWNAGLYLDEAHACGLYGQTRFSGLAEALNLEPHITLRMGTFSKALGGMGAWLVCQDPVLHSYVVNAARGLTYSTALPPVMLAVALAAIKLVSSDPAPRQQLAQLIGHIRGCAAALTPQAGALGSPIIPVIMPSAEHAMAAADAFAAEGMVVKAIRPPTVPTARLRFTVSATHKATDWHHAATALKAMGYTLC
jgi:8-amino-7-oxononanoate synthase